MAERKALKPRITEGDISREMTPGDIRRANRIIAFLVDNGDIPISDGAALRASAEPVLERLEQSSEVLRAEKEARVLSRRAFLRRIRNWSLATIVTLTLGKGAYTVYDDSWGNSAQARQRERDRRLEEQNTLGTEPSMPSHSRWTVRYAKADEGVFLPVGLPSDPLSSGTTIQLPSDRPNKLETTGIVIYDHIRTTDAHPVGKLAIVTGFERYASTNSEIPVTGEQWVLRDQPTTGINPQVLVFESPTSQKNYLSVTRSKSVGSERPFFQLRAYQPQPK